MQAVAPNRTKLRGGDASRMIEKLREKIDAILYRHAARICHHAEHGLSGMAPDRACPISGKEVSERIAPSLALEAPVWEPFAAVRLGANTVLESLGRTSRAKHNDSAVASTRGSMCVGRCCSA